MQSDELERRRAAWEAMSELFLDTETRWYVPRISLSLLETGYDEGTLTRIWNHEAVPEFAANLFVVAGEWAWLDFDESRMIRRMKRRGVLARFLDRLDAGVAAEVWSATLALRRSLLSKPSRQRGVFSELWEAYAHAWVEETLLDVSSLKSRLQAIADTGFSFEACVWSFERDFLPAYSVLLYGREVAQRREREENVRAMLGAAFSNRARQVAD